jgi:hypothetical protein
MAIWKDNYNTVRPHSAIGNVPPAVYAKLSDTAKQRDERRGSGHLFYLTTSRQIRTALSDWH